MPDADNPPKFELPADFEWVPKPLGESDPARIERITARMRMGDVELSPRRASRKRIGDASRLLTSRLVATSAPDDVLDDAAELLEQAAAKLEGYKQDTLYGFSEMANAGGQPDPIFDQSPLQGIANPLAPPMKLTEVDGVIHATVTFGQAYEGPPNCVHGGYVAAIFDELLGAAQSLSGAPGMTGTLKVRYESPTPLLAELRLEGRLVGVERRKIFTEGICYAGDRITARAEGIFISLNPGIFIDMLADRERRQEEQR